MFTAVHELSRVQTLLEGPKCHGLPRSHLMVWWHLVLSLTLNHRYRHLGFHDLIEVL